MIQFIMMKLKNIILLHGWGADTKKLIPLKIELEKLGWKVLIPKLAGFGKPAPSAVWGIKEYSDYVYDEAKKYFGKERFYVFGHSFGGGIAIKLASVRGNVIQGTILCSTRGISRGKSVKRMFFSVFAKAGKVLLITPPLADKFRKLLYKAAREHDYEKTKGIMKEIFKKVISEDLKPLLPKINAPVLILWGKEDKVTPVKDSRYIKSVLPTSKLILFENQGHRLPYEKPHALAREIEKWYQELH